jgi:single-strand DNA-binding protein
MSLTLNAVHLAGHITRDPESRTAGSSTVSAFSVALNRTFKKADGSKGEEVSYVDVEAWGKTAELVLKFLKAGSPVLVEGRLKQDTWEAEGKKRSKLFVVADRVHFLPNAKGNAGAPAPVGNAPVEDSEWL